MDLQVRALVQQALGQALQQCDLLLSPVAPNVAFRLGEKSQDPLAMYKEDLMTVPLNLAGESILIITCIAWSCVLVCPTTLICPTLTSRCGTRVNQGRASLMVGCVYAGLPGISVPCGVDDQTNMPVGLQFIGQAFGETALLETAHIFEQTMQVQQNMKQPAYATAS